MQKIKNRIEGLEEVVAGRKFLLVRGGKSYENLSIKGYIDSLPHVEFSGFTPNPLYEQVVEGVKIFNENKCEMIVAVGGGSAIDVAKCIKLYCKMDPAVNYLKQEMFDSGIDLVAIPTTAGTGSESTRHAVIYFEGAKQSISHISIVPNVAILEPTVLKLLPVYQKKCTMLDALAQAIESWWNVNSTDESKALSRKAVNLIKDNWQEYIEENTTEAAAKIMEAANLAGQAINITATTAAHAMSYKITSMFKFPHGHAVAVCLSEVWKYMLKHTDKCIDARGEEYLKSVFEEIPVDLNWFEDLMKKLDMSSPVSENREHDIDVLTASVNPVRLKNNPVELDVPTLKSLYEVIVK